MIDLEKNYSISARRMKKSAIRELLKLTGNDEIISFAGGLPAPDTFPTEEVGEITKAVMAREGKKALQYGATEGYKPFVEELIKWEKEVNGIDVEPKNLLVTTASQQALDLIGKVFIDPSDPVLVERPTYLGGLSAFNQYGAKFIGIKMDEDDSGISIDYLEEKLKTLKKDGEHYKFVYVVPDFQNPTGITIPYDKRKRLIELSDKYNFLLIEDTPYRELRYEGENVTPLYKIDTSGNVVSLHTMSKIFAPGLRLGWVVANEKLIDKLVTAKQAVDLCTPSFTQAITAEYMRRGHLKNNITNVIKKYSKKRDIMLKALDEHMPKHPDIKWTKPNGGLFLWITLPKYIDTETMFPEAIKENVAYIIGTAFDCYGQLKNTMRLNFSFPDEDVIEEGIIRLSNLIKRKLK